MRGIGSCQARNTHTAVSDKVAVGTYDNLYRRSIDEPEEFWDEVGRGVEWHVPYTRVLDNSQEPFTKWFVGGKLNTCHNAVDRHVSAGRGDQVALIHESPITKSLTKKTFSQLEEEVSRVAGGLARMGVGVGDRVMVYMPMVPEAVVAMLATCASEPSIRWCSADSRRGSWRPASVTWSRAWS